MLSSADIQTSKYPSADGNLQGSAAYQIWYLRHEIEDDAKARLQASGITLTQLIALHHIAQCPGLSGSQLARALRMTRQSAAILVNVLQRKQLIARPSRADGPRRAGHVLSSTGASALAKGTAVLTGNDLRTFQGSSITRPVAERG